MMKIYKSKHGDTIAVGYFRGAPVRGVAKLNPADNYDETLGQEIAECRCDFKLSCKQAKTYNREYTEMLKQANELYAKAHKLLRKSNEAIDRANLAKSRLEKLLGKA